MVKSEPMTPSIVFQRLSEGESLGEIARDKKWDLPVGRFTEWFTTEYAALYDAALKVRADQLSHERLKIVDAATPETASVAKLQSDTRGHLAGKWDRDRYGEKTDVRHSGLVPTLVIEIGGAGGAVEERVVGEVEEVEQLPEKPPATHEFI